VTLPSGTVMTGHLILSPSLVCWRKGFKPHFLRNGITYLDRKQKGVRGLQKGGAIKALCLSMNYFLLELGAPLVLCYAAIFS